MRNIFVATTLAIGMFLMMALPSANAAETQPAPEAAAAATTTKAASTAKKKRPHLRFSCTREECTCRGGADCNDLGSTHLCKIDMTCNGSTCRCSRN